MTCSYSRGRLSLRLILPYPPSVNHIYQRTRAGGVYLAPGYRRYLIEASASARGQAREQGVPMFTTPVSVDMIVTPPARKRRRDLDNLIKATFDALTKAGVWADDSLVIQLTLRFDSKVTSNHTKCGAETLTICNDLGKLGESVD